MDFENATKAQTKSHVLKGYEMRGLTFTQQSDGAWERWISCPKFFNVNETLGYEASELSKNRIIGIYEKRDGSLIRFVKINGEWRAKTKQVFDNEQAIASNSLLADDPYLLEFLNYMYDNGQTPLFEYTAPDNQIVLHYASSKLTLIMVRCDKTGSSYQIDQFENMGVNTAVNFRQEISLGLNDFIEKAQNLRGIEGWVIYFENKIAKLKTSWYFDQHRAKDQLTRSDKCILELVLNETFDDAISLLDPALQGMREALELKADKIRSHFNNHVKMINNLAAYYGTYDSRKRFYLDNKDYPYIGVAMAVIDGGEAEKGLKKAMLQTFNSGEKIKELFA